MDIIPDYLRYIEPTPSTAMDTSNHIEPSYAGPHQRYARAHIDGVMVPREVDCIVTCSPDTILIRAIYDPVARTVFENKKCTIEMLNIASCRVAWSYMSEYTGCAVMGGLLYMHFNILHSIDAGGETGTSPLPGLQLLQTLSPQNRRPFALEAHAPNKV
jgi:hypothetical protein